MKRQIDGTSISFFFLSLHLLHRQSSLRDKERCPFQFHPLTVEFALKWSLNEPATRSCLNRWWLGQRCSVCVVLPGPLGG